MLVIVYATVYRWAVLTLTEQGHSFIKSTQVVIEALTTAGFGGDTDLWREHGELAALVILMNLTGVLLVFLAIPLFAVPPFRKALDTALPTKSSLTDHVIICGHSAMDDVLRKELDDCKRRRQPVIEAAGRDRFIGCRVVAASEASECSAFACGETEHECPDEGGNLELAVAFDHAEFLGVLFEELRGKQCSEPTHNSR